MPAPSRISVEPSQGRPPMRSKPVVLRRATNQGAVCRGLNVEVRGFTRLSPPSVLPRWKRPGSGSWCRLTRSQVAHAGSPSEAALRVYAARCSIATRTDEQLFNCRNDMHPGAPCVLRFEFSLVLRCFCRLF